MQRTLKWLWILGMMWTLGCGPNVPKTHWEGPPQSKAEKAYRDALKYYESGQFIEASERFNKVRLNYPYSSIWTTLAELRLADVLFYQGHYAQAAELYHDFIRAHPTHKEVPYALYREAESHYREMPSDLWILPDRWQRELEHVRAAEKGFYKVMLKYPQSKWAVEAKTKREEVRLILAHYELYAAEFYLKRDHPLGAFHRLETLASHYPEVPIMDRGLFLMAHAMILLKDVRGAARALKRLVVDYPQSPWKDRSQAWLDEHGFDQVEPMRIGSALAREIKRRENRY